MRGGSRPILFGLRRAVFSRASPISGWCRRWRHAPAFRSLGFSETSSTAQLWIGRQPAQPSLACNDDRDHKDHGSSLRGRRFNVRRRAATFALGRKLLNYNPFEAVAQLVEQRTFNP